MAGHSDGRANRGVDLDGAAVITAISWHLQAETAEFGGDSRCDRPLRIDLLSADAAPHLSLGRPPAAPPGALRHRPAASPQLTIPPDAA